MIPASEVPHEVGQSVLLIGTADFGPLYEPMYAHSSEDAMEAFPGALGDAISRALQGGAQVFGMRVPKTSDPLSQYFVLEEAYEIILGQPFDWIVPLVIDDGSPIRPSVAGEEEGYAAQLARLCRAKWELMMPAIGLIQSADRDSPLPLPSSEPSLGRWIAVTSSMSGGDEPSMLAPVLASYIARAPRSRGLAGLPITSVRRASPADLSARDRKRKAKLGFLTVYETVRRGWALDQPVTHEPEGPTLTSMRVASECVWRIRYGMRSIMGEPQTVTHLETQEEIIENVLNAHPWVVGFDYAIERSGLYEQIIRLSLSMQNEVSHVEVVSRVSSVV